MLVNPEVLDVHLSDYSGDDCVRRAYMTLAYARLPDGMTVRPASHGFIERELRFEEGERWLYSAVLNRKWILWYFRKPALAAGCILQAATCSRFPGAEISSRGEIKLRLKTPVDAETVLSWIGAPRSP